MEVLSVIREKTVRTVLTIRLASNLADSNKMIQNTVRHTVRQKVEADSCVAADSRTERTVF
jgi:hypothetical protein